MRKTLLILIALCGWFALISQFYLIMQNRVASIPETVVRYFSFFTILTNIMVAVYCSMLVVDPLWRMREFLLKTKTVTAIAVYISIVGIVYNVILRFLWNPQGLQRVVDELLHTVIPILFVAFWIFFVPRFRMKGNSVLPWLLYPLIYLILILIRGSFSAFYPYPFIDVDKIGYNKVLINSTGMLAAFLVVSIIFLLMNRFKSFKPLNVSNVH